MTHDPVNLQNISLKIFCYIYWNFNDNLFHYNFITDYEIAKMFHMCYA